MEDMEGTEETITEAITVEEAIEIREAITEATTEDDIEPLVINLF